MVGGAQFLSSIFVLRCQIAKYETHTDQNVLRKMGRGSSQRWRWNSKIGTRNNLSNLYNPCI